MTINKNLVNGHKVKKSKIAANSSRFQKKSTRGKRSQQMVRSMRCINSVSELAEWREVSLKCIAKAAAIAGGGYWLTAASDLKVKFHEGSRDGRPCFFVSK